jgi:histidine triad (HIT) family protein
MTYDTNNIFARVLRGEAPACKVYEDDHNIAILDVMPQADGHTLILPKVSAENLFELDDDSAQALVRCLRHVALGVQAAFQPDGMRIMQLNGAAAGQTVFHFHMHIIPCYEGQPLRKHARSMAEASELESHADRIRQALAQL